MQRRIFRVDGVPSVAARDGFFETHGTLAALIEKRFIRVSGAVGSDGT